MRVQVQVFIFFFSFGCSLGKSETTSDLKILELEKKLSELEKITKMLSQKLTINNLTDMILKLKQSEEENRIIRTEVKLLTSKLKMEDNLLQDGAEVGPIYFSPKSSKQHLTNFRKQEMPYTESKYHILDK